MYIKSATLFALANLSTADALISSWDSKRHYVFWRPITAIREGDNDGNAATAGDTAWQPLINTEWAFKHYLLPLEHRGFDLQHRQDEDAGASE